MACWRNDHQNPLAETVVRAAEEVATAFALNHGQAVARLPGARLAGDASAGAGTAGVGTSLPSLGCAS